MTRQMTPRFGLFVSALLLCGAALQTGCEAADEGEGEVDMSAVEVKAQLEDLAVRTQELEDRQAIAATAACYGRGHDEIFRHLQGDQSVARTMLSKCHTDDIKSEVYFFADPSPMATLDSLDGLIGFIENFAVQSHYTGARNIVGDIDIQFTGPDTATMLSATSTPHFIQGTGDQAGEPTVDVVSARYIDELVRGKDGAWRSSKKTLILDEFWRGTGFYPFAPPPSAR